MDTFIFLSHGAIEDLLDGTGIFSRSSDPTSYNAVYRISNNCPILHILEVTDYYDIKTKETKCLCGLKISDGVNDYQAVISKDNWYLTMQKTNDDNLKSIIELETGKKLRLENYNKKRNFLRAGSVIMLYEYSFMETNNFLSEQKIIRDKTCDYPNSLLVFNQFEIIGYWDKHVFEKKMDDIITKTIKFDELAQPVESLISTSSECIEKSSKQVLLLPTHLISHIDLTTSINPNWSLYVSISKLLPPKEFEIKSTGKKGIFLRFQIQDHSGKMEVVGFNNIIEDLQLTKLRVGNCFLLQKCGINLLMPSCIAWPDDTSSKYFLVLNNLSIINQNTKKTLSLAFS